MKFLINTIVSALIIATVAEVGKRSSFIAALMISLPITSILALIFLYAETKDAQKVAALSVGIFWLVLPTLLFFLILPLFLRWGLSFWAALPLASGALIALFVGYAWALRKFGVQV